MPAAVKSLASRIVATATFPDGFPDLLTFFGRHLLPAPMVFLAPFLSFFRRHVSPMVTDLATHLLPLFGTQCRPLLKKRFRNKFLLARRQFERYHRPRFCQ